MKLKKLLEINQMCEERKAPWDVQESFQYNSKSLGTIDILDMDIAHFVRAFKLLNEQSIPKVGGSLHWISDRLTGLASELKEHTESGD
tara:strand:- start:381 stop:644 length:264 start_codon:yes stop_codon:yes gene_type:complete